MRTGWTRSFERQPPDVRIGAPLADEAPSKQSGSVVRRKERGGRRGIGEVESEVGGRDEKGWGIVEFLSWRSSFICFPYICPLISVGSVAAAIDRRQEAAGRTPEAASERIWASLYAIGIIIVVLPFLLFRFPLCSDYLAHVAWIRVLLSPADSPLRHVFDIRWTLIPNLGLPLFAISLGRFLTPEEIVNSYNLLGESSGWLPALCA